MARKRILSVFLCLMLLLGMLPVAVRAEEAYPLEVSDAHGKRGETVTVSVSLSRTAGIAGGNFTVEFDSTVLELTDAVAGDALAGCIPIINKHYGDGKVRVSFAGGNELSRAGELVCLTFRISKTAPLDTGSTITVNDVKLMDSDASTLFTQSVSGMVTPSAVGVSLGSDDCLPGQSVKLSLNLSGDLMPAGGELELHYNERMLKFGSVKGEQKLGNTGITLYGYTPEEGVIRISWAATECISENGQLCTIILDVKDTAAGPTEIGFSSVVFYDENSKKLDCTQPVSGVVNVVEQYNPLSTLYVVGGTLESDGKTAVVDVAVDGAGLVCGGNFTLHYEAEKAVLKKMEKVMGFVEYNPEKPEQATGEIRFTWADDSPSLDNETIVRLTFELTGTESAGITFSDVALKGKDGKNLTEIQVHGGQAGINCKVQAPVSEMINREEGAELSLTLYDACYTGEAPTEAVSIIAAYFKDGMMRSVALPKDSVDFDEFGIAKTSLAIALNADADRVRLFVVDANGAISPMCVSVEQILD